VNRDGECVRLTYRTAVGVSTYFRVVEEISALIVEE